MYNGIIEADIANEKNLLRNEYKSKRLGMSIDEKNILDSKICENITASTLFKSAKTVLIYYPTQREINVTPIAYAALSMGKKVAYPVSCKEDFSLIFRYVEDIESMKVGSYSIKEPDLSCKKFCGGENVLCIVPGLCFDRGGHRLGYGKGFYDRFLKDFKGTTLGAVYYGFLRDSIPCDENDFKIDYIMTERGMI